jgi:hypothetical protein
MEERDESIRLLESTSGEKQAVPSAAVVVRRGALSKRKRTIVFNCAVDPIADYSVDETSEERKQWSAWTA